MPTKEFPNHTKFRPALQRIIAESVAETLNETDEVIAASWRGVLQSRKRPAPAAAFTPPKDRARPKKPS